MFYGWQGFFIPNKPRYLPTFSLIASYDGTGTVKRTPHQEKPSLFNLLQQVEGLLPQIDYRALTKLFYALVDFEYEPKFQDNLNLREKVDSLFAHLWEITRIDPTLSIWMHAHMHAFIDNRKQLLAAYCQINQWVAVAGLLSRAEIGPGKNDFDAIASALFTEDQGQFSASELYNHTQQNKPGILITPRPPLHESAKISASCFSFYNRNRTKQKSLKLENLQNDHSALEASSNSL